MAIAASVTAFKVAANPEFKERVNHFMKKAAVDVMAEDAGTASHAARIGYARAILDGTAAVAEYARACMTNPTLKASGNAGAENQGITDNDLEFTVNSLFNAHAGVAT